MVVRHAFMRRSAPWPSSFLDQAYQLGKDSLGRADENGIRVAVKGSRFKVDGAA